MAKQTRKDAIMGNNIRPGGDNLPKVIKKNESKIA